MTRQGNLDHSQELPWCKILVHITDIFAQDGLLPEALVPSSRTFRWIRDPSVLGRLQACRQTRWRVTRLTVSCSLQNNIFGRMGSLGDGAWRYMRSSEKESAMGFPEGFTLSAWLTSDVTRDVQGVRALST